jgi:putative FmdB family regulatory protein
MPVYEFYCSDCHAIFNFLARRVNTEKKPACPRCGRPDLERQVSPFAISRNLQEPSEGMPELDESKMEQAMMALAGEMGNLDEDDPSAMASFMRKFSDMTGMSLGDGAEEALQRLEAGEDPELVEAEMGDLFDDQNLFAQKRFKSLRKRWLPPERDETLYTLE